MKREDLELIIALCRNRAGLKIDPEKTYLIESRLAPLARREDFGSIPDMLAALRRFRGTLPADFRFDRDQVNARDTDVPA